jgi:predicted O-methyltransferase YrrM
MTKEEILAAGEAALGYMKPPELEWLYEHAQGLVLEIGSFMGRSATVFGLRLKETGGQLHCVDPWFTDFSAQMVPEGKTSREVFDAKMAEHGLTPKIYAKRSLEAAAEITDGSLDLVFIDADHSGAAVRADIAAWQPKLKPGGILSGHNYQPEMAELQQVVDELFPQRELVDTIWSVKLQ